MVLHAGFLFGESRFSSDSVTDSVRYADEERRADSLLTALCDSGYPFAAVMPVPDSSGRIEFVIDLGPRIDSVRYVCRFSQPIRRQLQSRLAGSVRRFTSASADQKLAEIRSEIFVSAASVGAPMIEPRESDTIAAVPVDITVRKSVLADGVLAWSSEENGGVMGFLNFSMLNILRAGESAALSVYGDKEQQKASLNIVIPWFLGTPLSLKSAVSADIVQESYGLVKGELGAGYRFGGVWEAGLSGKLYELSGDSAGVKQFRGAAASLERKHPEYSAGEKGAGTLLSAGSGVLRTGSGTMPRSDFGSELNLQLPFGRRIALYAELHLAALAASRPEILHRAEKIQIGGVTTVRGYRENQYAFTASGYLRSELRFYFQKNGSFFIFGDPGAGTAEKFSAESAEYLFGYGAGVRIPAGKVRFTLVWARRYGESIGPGRLHVGIGN